MRKGISWLLVFLGAFLLVTGLVLKFYASDAVKVTPLSVNSTTRLVGTAAKLNPATGEVDDLDVKVRVDTETDDEASDDDVVVFTSATCVVVDEPDTPECIADEEDERLVTNSVDVFASDRKTAMATNEGDYLPAEIEVGGEMLPVVPHEGLVNKWPFGAEKKDYPFWDGILKRSVDATYAGTEEIDGLETYVYEVNVQEEPAEVLSGIDGIYSIEKTINIEPVTGSIIKQAQRDVRTQESGDPLIDLQVAYTDDTIAKNVADAKDSKSSLGLVSTTGPLVGIILGLLLLVGGMLMLRKSSSQA